MLDESEFDEQIRRGMEAAQVPSLAIAVWQGGEMKYVRGFGVTSVEEGGIPVTPATLFRVGSTTKPMVGFAVMRLVEQGMLSLDEPVASYLPWLQFSRRDAARRITLRMLLSHTTGLPTEYKANGPCDPAALEASLRKELPQYELFSPPGQIWSYSNPGVRLAAHIAERANGQLFPEMMRELVFEPLEMTTATFNPAVAMTYPLALPHEIDDNGNLCVMRPFANNAARYPAGGVIGSVLDVVKFGRALLSSELLTEDLLAEMLRPHARKFTRYDDYYGLTAESAERLGSGWIGHSGYSPPYRSQFVIHRRQRVVISMLYAEGKNFVESSWRILESIIRSLCDADSSSPNSNSSREFGNNVTWAEVAGDYASRDGKIATVALDDEVPKLTWDNRQFELKSIKEGIYWGIPNDDSTRVTLGIPHYSARRANFITLDTRPLRRVRFLDQMLQKVAGLVNPQSAK